MSDQFLKVNGICKNFGNTSVLKSINLQFERGGQYVISGASGSGKSTLLYLIGGLDRPDQGQILVDQQNLQSLSDAKLAQFRNENIGFVFQFHYLLPGMNSLDNILVPARIGGKNLKEVELFVRTLAKEIGVEHCLNKYSFELSGGEQQRINILRALSLKPKILLCDEPTGNLDSINSQKVANLLKKFAKDINSLLIIVTHDSSVASQFEHQIHIRDGQVEI